MHFYNFELFCQMLADDIRLNAYSDALQRAITKDSIVLDIGAGTGFFSLLAAQLGAKKVYAIEPNPLIQVAKENASANGLEDKIEFVQKLSTDMELKEKADVLVCDLRGPLPFYGFSVATVIDARKRLLKSNAVIIPQKDSVYFAIAESPKIYKENISKLAQDFRGFHMPSARKMLTSRILTTNPEENERFLAEPALFGVLDYTTIDETSFSTDFSYKITEDGVAHGLRAWFEADLGGEISFSNSPKQPGTVYGCPFLPFENEVEIKTGDLALVNVSVLFVNGNYTCLWNTKIYSGGDKNNLKAEFKQSTTGNLIVPPELLSRRSEYFVPQNNLEVEIERTILNMIDGENPHGDIADKLVKNFPDIFQNFENALNRVVMISNRYAGADN